MYDPTSGLVDLEVLRGRREAGVCARKVGLGDGRLHVVGVPDQAIEEVSEPDDIVEARVLAVSGKPKSFDSSEVKFNSIAHSSWKAALIAVDSNPEQYQRAARRFDLGFSSVRREQIAVENSRRLMEDFFRAVAVERFAG